MFVKYFIPEDGDDQSHPNLFRCEIQQPTIGQLKKAFPVPGTYHFRFLKTIGSMTVWFDISDENSAVPLSDGNVFMKVSRISAIQLSSQPKNSIVDPSVFSQSDPFTQPAKQSTPSPSSAKINLIPPPPLAPATDSVFIDFADTPSTLPSSSSNPNFASFSSPKPSGEGDLLGFDASSSTSSSSSASASSNVFFGLDSSSILSSSSTTTSSPRPTSPSPSSKTPLLSSSSSSTSSISSSSFDPFATSPSLNPMIPTSSPQQQQQRGMSGMNNMGGVSMGGMGGGGMNPMGGGSMGGMGGMNPMGGGSMGGMNNLNSMMGGGVAMGGGSMGGMGSINPMAQQQRGMGMMNNNNINNNNNNNPMNNLSWK